MYIYIYIYIYVCVVFFFDLYICAYIYVSGGLTPGGAREEADVVAQAAAAVSFYPCLYLSLSISVYLCTLVLIGQGCRANLFICVFLSIDVSINQSIYLYIFLLVLPGEGCRCGSGRG